MSAAEVDQNNDRTAESFESEASPRTLSGGLNVLVSVLSVGLSAYALYWVIGIVQPQIYRVSFLMVALVLTFLLFPGIRGSRSRVSMWDWGWIAPPPDLPLAAIAQSRKNRPAPENCSTAP